MPLDFKITEEEMLAALSRSGYLLESEVSAALTNLGFFIETNQVIQDPETGKSREIDLLFVIGTTLQTTLPAKILGMAYNRSIPIIEINPHPLGLDDYGILVLEGSVGAIFPQIMQELQSSN